MEANEVIDLTQTCVYHRRPLNRLTPPTSELIDLDASIFASPRTVATPSEPIVIDCETEELPAVNVTKESQPKKSTGAKKKKRPRTSVPATTPERPKTPHYGDCPICRDPLGIRPMASTKCGHVYCISCIDQAVKIEKRCPTCRKPLKGATAYHPLFL